MLMKYILGIDIGTGSTKAVALGADFKPLVSAQFHYPTQQRQAGYSEQDPRLIWEAFLACLDEVISKMGTAPDLVGLSAAMHSLIAVDAACRPLGDMMTWADSRSAAIAGRLKETAEGIAIYLATGTPLHAMSPLCKLIWMRENQAEVFAAAHKFISIKEYIWYQLFQEFKIEHSMASCTGLFDIHSAEWHLPALAMAGISSEKLSGPVSTSYRRKGAAAAHLSASLAATSFVIGATDGCLANVGSEALQPGVAALTIGTSAAVRIASRSPLLNRARMPFSYILDEETYICGGAINNGGMALQWLLKEVFAVKEVSAEVYEKVFADLSELKPGSDGLLFLPYLTGERAPIWDEESSGTFFGLKLIHTQAHFARALLEGICFALYDVLEGLAEISGDIVQLQVSGGFVRSAVWLQILADISGKKIVLVHTEDASAIGAAYFSAKSLGMEIPCPAEPTENVLHPNPGHHHSYSRYFNLFKQLYVDLKSSMHHLSQLNNS